MLLVLFVLINTCMSFASFDDDNNVASEQCVCEDKSLCKALQAPPRQEVYGFSTETSNWKHWNWNKLTTVAIFGSWDPILLCYAHSKNVRIILKADYPLDRLSDSGYREKWLSNFTSKAKRLYADGVNIDVEQIVKKGSKEETLLTLLTKETRDRFHKEIPGSQVTFDVAWSPDCIDSRCYDYKGLAEVSDFLIIMSYDEKSQIYGPCLAGANSGLEQTSEGIQKYLALGIDPNKLVVGLPWYGYNYPCINFNQSICEMKRVHFRGVNCSDAVGRQYCYKDIIADFLPQAIDGRHFDEKSRSPYFQYKDKSDDAVHQIWYDDPESLKIKYNYVINKVKMRGLSFWNIDCLDYGTNPKAEKETKDMWDAVFVN